LAITRSAGRNIKREQWRSKSDDLKKKGSRSGGGGEKDNVNEKPNAEEI